MNTRITTTFFRSVQTLRNLISETSSHFDVNVKSKKTLGTSLGLTPSLKTSVDARVEALIRKWIIWKIGTVILFKTNLAEKDVCHAARFVLCYFLFCAKFLNR